MEGLREALVACRRYPRSHQPRPPGRSLPDARDVVEKLTAAKVKLKHRRIGPRPNDPIGRLLFNESNQTQFGCAPGKA